MSEIEKKMMENIANALPHMTEFQRGYLLGTAEAMAEKHKEEKRSQKA
jgi:hypothetical protein